MKKLVTIVTPCYNSKETISQTIESVLQQTFSNWEMLIVDDCFTDSSPEIIKKYADKDYRIKYFRTQNKSGSPSLPRNIGIENAKGEYIAFLDSDDLWLPYKLEHQLKFLEKNGYDLVYSYYEKIDWEGRQNNRVIRTREKTRYDDILKSNSIPCLTSMI